MTTPNPQQPSPQPDEIIKALIEAFHKLPPLLSYGGLILVVALLALYFTGDWPDILLIVALSIPVIFLIYSYMDRRFELKTRELEQKHELEKQVQQYRHKEKMADKENREPSTPKQITIPTALEDDVPAQEWERRYLDHLMALCRYPSSMALVDIKEAGLGGHKLALERIFTSLEVPASQEGRDLAHLTGDDLEHGERMSRESALAAISRPENKNLVILGAPGSGKSTLINYLTLCLAGDHRQNEDINQDHLRQYDWGLGHLRLWPVRVILREYAARGLSQKQDIWSFIAADLSRPTSGLAGYVSHLKKRLETEGGILLLDGLDEVDKAMQVREALKTNIELFARDFSRVRVVVTSRPYAYGSGWELDNFKMTRLLPFSDEQIQFFIEQWYTVMGKEDVTLGPEKAEGYQESLSRQMKQSDSLRRMARHPLLLTMMVYIHRGREGGALPQRREELYRLCVVLLLDLWRRSKTVPGQETKTLVEVLGMDIAQLQEALAEVAFWAHHDQPAQSQTADIPGTVLAGILHQRSKKSGINLNDVIEYVRDRAGLLADHGRNADDTDDVYRFPHRTFQEYLAATHLLSKPDFPADITRLGRDDPARWREVVLLAGAAVPPAMQWLLVEALYGRKSLPASAESVSQADWWGAFLAGQVLTETEVYLKPLSMYEETLTHLQNWHKAIVEQGLLPARDRALAGQVLAVLGDDRPGVGVDLGTGLPDIAWGEEVPAGKYRYQDRQVDIPAPYRLSRYPITNTQFQCFVTADDFDNPHWWEGMPTQEKQVSEPYFPTANCPRERVSWYQAMAFCRWLTAKLHEGRLPARVLTGDVRQYEITLPHEHEWEVAACWDGIKADGRHYPWGNEFDEERTNTDEGGIGQTTAVGMYPSGQNEALELYDLSGNVWEWCRNKYQDPNADAVDESNAVRVLRGGSWFLNQSLARASYRFSYSPVYRYYLYGFRLGVVVRPPSQDH